MELVEIINFKNPIKIIIKFSVNQVQNVVKNMRKKATHQCIFATVKK